MNERDCQNRPTNGSISASQPDPGRATRACAALREATDGETLIAAVFRLLLATVSGDHASLAAHGSGRVHRAIRISSRGSSETGQALSGVADQRWVKTYAAEHLGIKIFDSQDALRAGPPSGPSSHILALCFWREGSPLELECVFCVHRAEAQDEFGGRDRERLTSIHPEIARAVRRVRRIEQERSMLESIQYLVHDLPLGAVLVGWELTVIYHNLQARKTCAEWRLGPAARQRTAPRREFVLPPELTAACAALKEEWRHELPRDARSRRTNSRAPKNRVIHQAGCPALRATVSLVQRREATLGEPGFLIMFHHEEWRPTMPVPAFNLGALAVLTPCERKVALAAADGADNAAIAASLGRCVGTVKAELHAVFTKLHVRNRTQLLGLLR